MGRLAEVTLSQVAAFAEVAWAVDNEQTCRAAAERLNYTSPAPVMALIRRLAKSLGETALVEVDHQGFPRLTRAGRELRAPLLAVHAAAQGLDGATDGVLFHAYPSIAARLLTRVPALVEDENSKFVLHAVTDATRSDRGETLLQRLRDRVVDLVVAPSGTAPELEAWPLYPWSLRATIGKRGVPRARRSPDGVTAEELQGRLIACAPEGHTSRRLIAAEFQQAHVALRIGFESTDPHELVAVARNSDNIVAIIPDDSVGEEPTKIGPVLLGATGPLGGSYSLYMRPQANPDQPTKSEDLIRNKAIVVLRAFNPDAPGPETTAAPATPPRRKQRNPDCARRSPS